MRNEWCSRPDTVLLRLDSACGGNGKNPRATTRTACPETEPPALEDKESRLRQDVWITSAPPGVAAIEKSWIARDYTTRVGPIARKKLFPPRPRAGFWATADSKSGYRRSRGEGPLSAVHIRVWFINRFSAAEVIRHYLRCKAHNLRNCQRRPSNAKKPRSARSSEGDFGITHRLSVRVSVGLRYSSHFDFRVDVVASSRDCLAIELQHLRIFYRRLEHCNGRLRRQALGLFQQRSQHHDVGYFGRTQTVKRQSPMPARTQPAPVER